MEEDIPDVEMSFSPPTIESKEIVDLWKDKLQQGLLSSTHFKEFWRSWVPRIYSPSLNESCLNWSFDDEKAQKLLFNTLEEFICDGDPAVVLPQISQLDKPPSVCGKVFKMAEATYSCRECGMDNTCVLCVDCFKHSEHRFHKYKMGTSGGGGCCDCGDREAWKKDPFCSIHIAGTQVQPEQAANLPEEMAERVRIVYDAVLWHSYHLLTLEHTGDLRLKDSSDDIFDIDTYCTVLYNDEIHTFEQVINTLTRVIKCNQKNAIEFVTNIDREGRAVVKCSTFKHCNELKTEIEKFTSRNGNKPLKVLVIHAHVVAHQLYAMKLLAWLQIFLSHGEGFRKIFAEVALKPKGNDPTIIKGILQRDSQLWKSARTHWHRLLISGMLMEYENKKALAVIFTKHYGNVMKDFIRDDHDHSFSVSSLSVQIFTVPTLAHYLIAEQDVLFILLNSFISECARKCNKNGKLEFERNVSGQTFKRAQYMLYDLRYLLSVVPEPSSWTDALRRGFLQGLSLLLNLLTMMQGMDSVSRQVGQHMEFEPEWESAFNLHIKLAYCISLALQWCGTDKVVLVKAYRATLKKLEENPSYDPTLPMDVRELADHSVGCLPYDVATQPVSIHLPLSRFLAGLHLHLEKFGLHFDSSEFSNVTKPTPVQIIEPVLRTQVMIAQVHAGMWRRNGYALLNQLYFYQNVKCRTEMLDRDIIVLQMGAALIESNEFLIHLLNKFNLINWANSNFEINSLKSPEEDSIRQTINLVEEFLQSLITIIGERYVPGVGNVTTEDRIKKEIIQQLCIKPLPHSYLNKTLPDDITHETALDNVIDSIADFKKPTQGSGRGVYELKPNLFENYNVFFYHYTREELSKSEETQRKRRKTSGELECCPPPELPQLTESFGMIANLLQCDVMLYIMQTVLERCTNLRARSFSESQFHKILHLIGYALKEEQSKRYPILLFTGKAAKWRILNLLEELRSSQRVEAHKDLLTWTIVKYKEVAAMHMPETAKDTVAINISTSDTVSNDRDEKEWRAKMAAQRRAKIMAQMTAMQNNFLKENAILFQETHTELGNASSSTSSSYPMDVDDVSCNVNPIALGRYQTQRLGSERTAMCILCQEEQKIHVEGIPLVLVGFVQQSTVLRQNKSIENEDDPLYLSSNLGPAPHVSTCGHIMHMTCYEKYFENVKIKEQRRPYRSRNPASFDVDKKEFLCPLCECLSNTVLPLLPPLILLQPSPPKNDITFEDWLKIVNLTLQKKIQICRVVESQQCGSLCTDAQCAACENNKSLESGIVCKSDCNISGHQFYYSCPIEHLVTELGSEGSAFAALFSSAAPQISDEMSKVLHLFSGVTYAKGLRTVTESSDVSHCFLAWKCCAYTIHTVELILRDANKPLLGALSSRQRDCLETLVRTMAVLGASWKKQSVVVSGHAIRLLSMLIDHTDDGPSVLHWDSLGYLIPLTFALPCLFSRDSPIPVPTGGSLELHTLHLVFAAHLTKIFITTEESDLHDDPMEESDGEAQANEEEPAVMEILKLINKNHLSSQKVWRRAQEAAIPFLRCCTLFYHYLTDVPAPQTLTEFGGDTFANMCSYLGLPTSSEELLVSPTLKSIIAKWCKHPEVIDYLNKAPNAIVVTKEPLSVSNLVSLPVDYSELINTVSNFVCPNSDREDSRNPTMCLVCGEMLCSQSYCCQTEYNTHMMGACNYHAQKCGAGIGIFLRVRECEVLFLASPLRGCAISPPYLDDYGETDQGLRRGNPLWLCPERYKKLHGMWLNHTIQEEIARAIETSKDMVTWQWQHI